MIARGSVARVLDYLFGVFKGNLSHFSFSRRHFQSIFGISLVFPEVCITVLFSLLLTVWFSMTLCEKKRKKDGSSNSENLPPTPCHVTQCARRFAACKVFFFFCFWQLFFSFYARSSSWTPSPALSCLPSIFTHFLHQIHHSESFQLVCHESPLKVSQQCQRHSLSVLFMPCKNLYNMSSSGFVCLKPQIILKLMRTWTSASLED